MSTGIDIEFVKQTYQRMSDEELIRTATQDAQGLTPEAMQLYRPSPFMDFTYKTRQFY